MSLTHAVRVTVFSWLCACACASQPIDDDHAAHAPASPTEFIRAFAASVCSGFDKCCGEQGLAFDAAACPTSVAAEITSEITTVEALQVDWDPEAAARCIQDYTNAVCGDHVVPDVKRNCSLMFRGRVAVGEPCTAEVECRAVPGNTAHCDLGASGLCQLEALPVRGKPSASCNGTCALEGETSCVAGLYNQNTAPGAETLPLCSKREGLQCSPDVALGWSCQPLLAVGDNCANNLAGCSPGAFCNVDTSLCEEQLPVGAGPCSHFDQACQSPAVCDFQTDECIALKANAESCDSSSTNCQSGYCNADGLCSRPELRASLCADPAVLSGHD